MDVSTLEKLERSALLASQTHKRALTRLLLSKAVGVSLEDGMCGNNMSANSGCDSCWVCPPFPVCDEIRKVPLCYLPPRYSTRCHSMKTSLKQQEMQRGDSCSRQMMPPHDFSQRYRKTEQSSQPALDDVDNESMVNDDQYIQEEDDEFMVDDGQFIELRKPSGQIMTSRKPSGQVIESKKASGQVMESRKPRDQVMKSRKPSGQIMESRKPSGQLDENMVVDNQQFLQSRSTNRQPSVGQSCDQILASRFANGRLSSRLSSCQPISMVACNQILGSRVSQKSSVQACSQFLGSRLASGQQSTTPASDQFLGSRAYFQLSSAQVSGQFTEPKFQRSQKNGKDDKHRTQHMVSGHDSSHKTAIPVQEFGQQYSPSSQEFGQQHTPSTHAIQEFGQQYSPSSQEFGQQYSPSSQEFGQQHTPSSHDFGQQYVTAANEYGHQGMGNQPPREEKDDCPELETCNINAAMRQMGALMNEISHVCECYYESCPVVSLTASDRRHLKTYHRGVLPRHSSSSPKKKQSLSSKNIHKSLQSLITGHRGSSFSQNSFAIPQGAEELDEDETFVLKQIPSVSINRKISAPLIKSKHPVHDRVENDSISSVQQLPLDETMLASTLQSHRASPSVSATPSKHVSFSTSPIQSTLSTAHSNDYPTSAALSSRFLASQMPSDIFVNQESNRCISRSTQTSRDSLFQTVDHSTSPIHGSMPTNNSSQFPYERADSEGQLNEDNNSLNIEGVSLFPTTVIQDVLLKSKGRERSGDRFQQGIYLMTKPGTYIIRKPQRESSIHLIRVSEGDCVKMSI